MLARLFFLILGVAIAAGGYLIWRPDALGHPVHIHLGVFTPYRLVIAALLGQIGAMVAIAGLLRRSAGADAARRTRSQTPALDADPHGGPAAVHPTVRQETYVSMMRHGDDLLKVGRADAALDFYRHAVALSRTAVEHEPEAIETRRQLADALSGLAIAHDELRQLDQAIENHEQSLTLRRAVARQAPDDSTAVRLQCVELQRLADCRAARGQRSRARDLYAESLALEEQLAARDPKNPLLRDDLAATRRRIGELGVAQVV
jgi:tetratricopeptide (TPR) repeat protein